jgi:hypothetical protein
MLTGSQYFLYLGALSGALFRSGPLHTELLGEFDSEESAPAAFASLLRQRPALPVWVLVDSVDEDYRLETLPHVAGKARLEMVSRRLRQLYRGQPFSSAWLQGREKTGRKDDRYLMASLNDSTWLLPWLSAIQSLNLPLAGVTPVSGAAQALVSRLKIRDPHLLLVSRQRAGTRFSYFEHGLLRFSRLTPAGKGTVDCADEVSRTLLYLSSQRIITREVRCTVLLLDFEHDPTPVLASLNADPLFDARQITAAQASGICRAPASLLRRIPGAALVCAQAAETPVINLAPATHTASHVLFRRRRLLRASAAVILLGGVAAAGTQWLQAAHYRNETARLTHALANNQRLYQEALKVYPVVSIAPEQLQQAVQTAGLIESGAALPKQALAALSAALDRFPGIVLQQLKWENRLTAGRPATCQVEIRAEVQPFDGNYRAALQQIQAFIASLGEQPGASSVELLQSPASLDDRAPLSGSTLETRTHRQALFKVGFDFHGGRP